MAQLETWELVQCKMSAEAFVAAYEKGYDMTEVYKFALTSFIGSITYNKDQCGIWCGGKYVLSLWEADTTFSHSHTKYDVNTLEWVGWMLRFWIHYRPDDTSQFIFNTVSWDTWLDCYTGFHCIAPELAIDNLIEIHSQKVR